jgi:flagellar biosynthesis/type III secretory pathway chaperone
VASLVDELVNVLREETRLYYALEECADEKTQILVRADVPALEQLTITEQARSDELLALSNKQVQILNDIKTVLGRKDEKLTVTTLIGYLASQPQVQEKLTIARDDLIAAAKRVQDKNQQNVILLHHAIEMTEFDITLFKSMRQAPETANYDKNAYNTGTILGTSGFDAKQ